MSKKYIIRLSEEELEALLTQLRTSLSTINIWARNALLAEEAEKEAILPSARILYSRLLGFKELLGAILKSSFYETICYKHYVVLFKDVWNQADRIESLINELQQQREEGIEQAKGKNG